MLRSARNNQVLALVFLGGTVLFWGTSFAAVKSTLAYFEPMTVMWFRWLIAAIVFLPFWRRIPKPERRAGDGRLLGLAALFIPCLYFGFEAYALRFTTSSQAGVITAILPLIVAVGAWILLAEKPGWQQFVALAISLVGVAVLSTQGSAQEAAPDPMLGNLLELAAMFAAAGSTLTVKHLSTRYDPWFITGMQTIVGAVFFAPFAFASGTSGWASAPASVWAAVAYLGVFCSLVAFGLYNTALKLMPAGRAALAINLIPAVAVLAGWLALGESLSVPQIAACIAIIGAVVFAELAGRTSAEAPAPLPPLEHAEDAGS